MTTELETKHDIYYLLLRIFACVNVINVIYFFHRVFGFKKTAAQLSELFWCANDALELYNGRQYDLLYEPVNDDEKCNQPSLEEIIPKLNEEVKYENKYLNDIKNCLQYTPDLLKQRDPLLPIPKDLTHHYQR